MKKVTTKIIHIPYITFTSNEETNINIGSIQHSNDMSIECYLTNVADKNALSHFYGSAESDENNNAYELYLCQRGAAIFVVQYDCYINTVGPSINYPIGGDMMMRFQMDGKLQINDKVFNIEKSELGDFTFNNFYLGGIYITKNPRKYPYVKGNYHYLRFERKNSLYKHYLPCVRIYNLVDDNNELISENNIDYGFFESVNQDYYIADSNSIPAHTGETLNEDYSNLLDINGNIIPI